MFDGLSEKFSNALRNIQGKGTITEKNIEDTLKDVRTALLDADVSFKVVKHLSPKSKKKPWGKGAHGSQPWRPFVKIVQEQLTRSWVRKAGIDLSTPDLLVVLVVGHSTGREKPLFLGNLPTTSRTRKKRMSCWFRRTHSVRRPKTS